MEMAESGQAGEVAAPGGGNREALSTVAAPAGGPARSSGEASVMDVERRGRIICDLFARATGLSREETGERVRVFGQAVRHFQAVGVGGVQESRG
jgi:hypothetical protein